MCLPETSVLRPAQADSSTQRAGHKEHRSRARRVRTRAAGCSDGRSRRPELVAPPLPHRAHTMTDAGVPAPGFDPPAQHQAIHRREWQRSNYSTRNPRSGAEDRRNHAGTRDRDSHARQSVQPVRSVAGVAVRSRRVPDHTASVRAPHLQQTRCAAGSTLHRPRRVWRPSVHLRVVPVRRASAVPSCSQGADRLPVRFESPEAARPRNNVPAPRKKEVERVANFDYANYKRSDK